MEEYITQNVLLYQVTIISCLTIVLVYSFVGTYCQIFHVFTLIVETNKRDFKHQNIPGCLGQYMCRGLRL